MAHSYSIRNLYRRQPVDRSSQVQVIPIDPTTQPQTDSLKERQTFQEFQEQLQEPTIPGAVTNMVSASGDVLHSMRNELSNLGGHIIGGFTDLTGLKLKEKPGFHLELPGKAQS